MEKKNVYVVTGRNKTDAQSPAAMSNVVVCSISDNAVRDMMRAGFPSFEVVSVVSLVKYEETVAKVKSVLAGQDKSWPVFIDPVLQAVQHVA